MLLSHPTQLPDSTLAILCDFDGTATPMDVCMLLYETFAGPPCPELNRLWRQGSISTLEEAAGCYDTIEATRQEMEAALDQVPLDPGFGRLVELCARRTYPLAIVSDGFDWYIDYVLRRHGFSGLEIFANQVHFEEGGHEVTFPWHNPHTPRFGISKPSIIARFRDKGCRVAYIGDGISDLEAAVHADLLFAKGSLLAHCQRESIPAIPFTHLSDVADQLERLEVRNSF